MILYGYFRSSAAYRVRIALNLKNLTPEQRSVHLLKKINLTPEYKAVNPQGLVPYLIDDDFHLSQSLAIIEYLDELHPEPPLLPKNIHDRAAARAIAQMIACDIHPLNNTRILSYLTDKLQASDAQKTLWYCHWIHEGFTALETVLANRKTPGAFCVGDSPTIADICLIPQIANANRFKCSLEPFPNIMAAAHHAQKLPAFIAAEPLKQTDAE